MKLADWVDEMGGVCSTARALGVSHTIVRHWRDGDSLPRPIHLWKIITKSDRRVSFENVITGFLNKQRARNRRKGK